MEHENENGDREMKDILTRGEADKTFEASEVNFKLKLCPVFKTTCNFERCHSFFRGSIREHMINPISEKAHRKTTYHVSKSMCTCAIVTGIIEHDGI